MLWAHQQLAFLDVWMNMLLQCSIAHSVDSASEGAIVVRC